MLMPEIIACALCGRLLPFTQTYSPADEAICPPCDTEVTGSHHPDYDGDQREVECTACHAVIATTEATAHPFTCNRCLGKDD